MKYYQTRPPWPRQIITPILPTVTMLNLGGERLPPPHPPPPKKIFTCTPIWVCYHYYRVFFCSFTIILEYSDHHHNLISSLLYYPGPRPKISSQFVHNFLSNVVHKQTEKQTNQRHQKHNLLCQGGKYLQ